MVCDGAYLLLPNYTPAAGSVLSQVAGSPEVSIGIAVLYIVSGVVAFLGAWSNRAKVRRYSTGLLFISMLFTVLIRLIVVGLTPTLWVWPMILAAVAAIDNWSIGDGDDHVG